MTNENESLSSTLDRLNADSLRIGEEQNRVMDEFAALVSSFNEKYVALMEELSNQKEQKK